MYKLHERLCDRKLNDHFVSLCRTTHVFCFVQFYRSFIPIGIFMFALILFFFFLLLFRSGAISILFLSLMNLLSFFFTLSRSSSIFFFTNFYLKKCEIIFLNVLLLWLLNLFATFIFFLCYDVRIILHFEIIITYNLKILYLSSRVLFFSKKYN